MKTMEGIFILKVIVFDMTRPGFTNPAKIKEREESRLFEKYP